MSMLGDIGKEIAYENSIAMSKKTRDRIVHCSYVEECIVEMDELLKELEEARKTALEGY